jgi:protein-disulfide isomerase
MEGPVFGNRNLAIIALSAVVVVGLLAIGPFSKSAKEQSVAEAANAAQTSSDAAPASQPAEAKPTAAAQPAASSPESTAPAQPLPEMSIGHADAPVTIVEYSSLSCPHCAAFHKEVLPELKTEYIDTGKVRYVVREFPLNDAALAGAVIARCLDPSRYFAFVDMLFSKQEDWAFKDDAFAPLKKFAKQAGLPDDQFNKCLDDEALQKKILAVREQGAKEGVSGTPSFFVNGKLIKGPPTLKTLAEAAKPYLNTKG